MAGNVLEGDLIDPTIRRTPPRPTTHRPEHYWWARRNVIEQV
jgi:hypothetical protein